MESGKQILSVTEVKAELKFAYKMFLYLASSSSHINVTFCPQETVFQGEHRAIKKKKKLRKSLSLFPSSQTLVFKNDEKSGSLRTKVGEIK